MTLEELESMLKAAASVGAEKVKITGGEPLVRKDIVDVVAACSRHFKEVSLTTNGVLLENLALPLRKAGLARINISMDSLNEQVYSEITGRNDLPRLLRGIDAARRTGFQSMKLNTVVLKGLNHTELEDLIAFSAEKNAIFQAIELTTRREDMDSPFYQTYHYDLTTFEKKLSAWSSGVQMNEIHNRKRYDLRANGWSAVVEVVRPMNNRDFCASCTRIRVTSDGKIKPCLLTNSGEIDTLDTMYAGGGREALRDLFVKAISSRQPYWD